MIDTTTPGCPLATNARAARSLNSRRPSGGRAYLGMGSAQSFGRNKAILAVDPRYVLLEIRDRPIAVVAPHQLEFQSLRLLYSRSALNRDQQLVRPEFLCDAGVIFPSSGTDPTKYSIADSRNSRQNAMSVEFLPVSKRRFKWRSMKSRISATCCASPGESSEALFTSILRVFLFQSSSSPAWWSLNSIVGVGSLRSRAILFSAMIPVWMRCARQLCTARQLNPVAFAISAILDRTGLARLPFTRQMDSDFELGKAQLINFFPYK